MKRLASTVSIIWAVGVTLLAQAPPAATRASFADWLADLRGEALSRGIRPEVLDEALGEVQEPLPVVLERDRAQAEVVLPLETCDVHRDVPDDRKVTAARKHAI